MYSLHCYTLVGQTNFAVFIVKQHSTKCYLNIDLFGSLGEAVPSPPRRND